MILRMYYDAARIMPLLTLTFLFEARSLSLRERKNMCERGRKTRPACLLPLPPLPMFAIATSSGGCGRKDAVCGDGDAAAATAPGELILWDVFRSE